MENGLIKIKRTGALNKLSDLEDKEIPFSEVESVELKKPGWIRSGYIRFNTGETKKGLITNKTKEENTVKFHTDYEFFKSIKEKVLWSHGEDEGDNDEDGEAPLEVLKRRLAKGEITEEEFKRKKELLTDE